MVNPQPYTSIHLHTHIYKHIKLSLYTSINSVTTANCKLKKALCWSVWHRWHEDCTEEEFLHCKEFLYKQYYALPHYFFELCSFSGMKTHAFKYQLHDRGLIEMCKQMVHQHPSKFTHCSWLLFIVYWTENCYLWSTNGYWPFFGARVIQGSILSYSDPELSPTFVIYCRIHWNFEEASQSHHLGKAILRKSEILLDIRLSHPDSFCELNPCLGWPFFNLISPEALHWFYT